MEGGGGRKEGRGEIERTGKREGDKEKMTKDIIIEGWKKTGP